MGSVSMGIAGSIVNPDFFQEYLGMRNESVDLTEIIRRMTESIYDKEEFAKAMAWTEKYCKTLFSMPAVNVSFVLPLICFVVIVVYGYKMRKES